MGVITDGCGDLTRPAWGHRQTKGRHAMQRVQSPQRTMLWSQLRSAGLFAVRYGIGGAIIVAGVVVLAVVPGDQGAYGFASALGAGSAVLLLNLLYRVSVNSERDRDREEEARRYLDEHGHWPADDEKEQVSWRQWTLPAGVITAEEEERERRGAPARGTGTSVLQPQ